MYGTIIMITLSFLWRRTKWPKVTAVLYGSEDREIDRWIDG